MSTQSVCMSPSPETASGAAQVSTQGSINQDKQEVKLIQHTFPRTREPQSFDDYGECGNPEDD